MDISTIYKSIAPSSRGRNRSAIPPVKPTQDRRRQNRKRDRKPIYDEDVVVVLSGRAPDPEETKD